MRSLLARLAWKFKVGFPARFTPQHLERIGVDHSASWDEVIAAEYRWYGSKLGLKGATLEQIKARLGEIHWEVLQRKHLDLEIDVAFAEAERDALDLERADLVGCMTKARYQHFVKRRRDT